MKWKIIAIGKPSLSYARVGLEEYLGRLRHYTDVEFVALKDGREDQVAARMLKASEGCLRILLDERGDALTTAALRERVDRWEGQGVKSAAFLIGGAEGHGEKIRGAADLVLGLSAFTLQHELALVVLAEQLYRVYTMKRGESYHR